MAQGKRGMMLEKTIEYSNTAYKNKGWALINKVPTPWTVHYDKRTGKVLKAFPKEKSTVDFLGVSHGRSIAFESKSTNSNTRFDLSNIAKHQLQYLLEHKEQGGISFLIIEFAKMKEIYFLKVEDLHAWFIAMEGGGRKSIPYSWFYLNCDQIKSGKGVALDYLKFCQTVK